jgi:uncharacterized integral membrane protein
MANATPTAGVEDIADEGTRRRFEDTCGEATGPVPIPVRESGRADPRRKAVRREHRGGDDPEDPRRRDHDDHMRELQRHRQTRAAKSIVLLALITILVLFIVWNAHQVPVSFVFLTRRIGLIWVMLACAVIGGVVGFFIGRPGRAVRFGHDDDEQD